MRSIRRERGSFAALIQEIRLNAAGTSHGRAQAWTIMTRLIKIGGRVETSVRRIVFHVPVAFPDRDECIMIARALSETECLRRPDHSLSKAITGTSGGQICARPVRRPESSERSRNTAVILPVSKRLGGLIGNMHRLTEPPIPAGS